jgi:hypothetical protein
MWTLLEGFSHLHSSELDALLEAPALITVLVGAADGELDREERTWSDRLMQSRTYNNPKHLNAYYSVVANGFLEKVDAVLAAHSDDISERNQQISDKLRGINPILAKLDHPLGTDLYLSYLNLAKETAKASGGFLRIGAISAAEAAWINLPMLHAIAEPHFQKWEDDVAPEDEELNR